jgi:hypothetical protein
MHDAFFRQFSIAKIKCNLFVLRIPRPCDGGPHHVSAGAQYHGGTLYNMPSTYLDVDKDF